MRHRGKKLAAAVVTFVAFGVTIVSPSAARAGSVTWNSYYPYNNSLMLDVWQSNPNNGATIDVWPSNGTNAQNWWDTPISNGYWEEQNVISWKALDRWNDQYCVVTDWDYWGGSEQLWKELRVASGQWQLLNQAGCNGNSTWDSLANNLSAPNGFGPDPDWTPRTSNAILRTEDDCGGPGAGYQDLVCFWH